MCNSVLCRHLARAAPLYDLNEQGGADVGKVLVGQILPWCGVHTKRMKELKKQDAGSIFRVLSNPRCGGSWTRYWAFWARKSLSKKEEPMKERKWAWTSCCFTKKSVLTFGEEFLCRGYFTEQPLSKTTMRPHIGDGGQGPGWHFQRQLQAPMSREIHEHIHEGMQEIMDGGWRTQRRLWKCEEQV